MTGLISVEDRGHVRLIGLNRPEKRNAFTLEMMAELGVAYGAFEREPNARCAVLFAHGKHFCGGLELESAAPNLVPITAQNFLPVGAVDPWGVKTPQVTKPVVVAVQGHSLTLAIELILAADITVATSDALFGQLEVTRGIFPFGGSTVRLPQLIGYQNAMRYLLTGDMFGATEAQRIGFVQEVVAPGEQLLAAIAIAERIASAAPLGVAATLRTARRAVEYGNAASIGTLYSEVAALYGTNDAKLGFETYLDKQRPTYTGK